MNRREAVKTMGGIAASFSFLPLRGPGSLPLVRPLGVQLYTVRESMGRSVERTLATIAEIGFDEVEFAGYFDRAPRDIAQLLSDNGLVSPASHVAFEAMAEGWEVTLDAAAALGNTHVIVPWVPPQSRSTLSDYRRLADRFNSAAASARDRGLRFAYHNHDFEFTPADGVVPYDILCDNTDPALVDFELDIFWIVNGGDDPRRVLERWPGRFPMVHVKDRSVDGAQVDIGTGTIDWRELLLPDRGIKHFFIEHDDPADPMEFVRRAYRYMADL